MHLVDLRSTTSKYISVLVEILGEGLAPKHGPAKPGEQLCRSMNPSLAAGALGLRPEGDLAGGLKETFRFFGAL
jgi:UDP-glucose 4-epimerase